MDSLGTTSIVTDYSTGAVVQDELHYPWGQQWTMLGTMQEERFARLHHRDNETSLDPTLHRMFSSNQGRWLSPDALGGNVFSPQSLNRYAYALNGPTALTDSLGLYPQYPVTCYTSSCAWQYYGWGPYPGYNDASYANGECVQDGIEAPCGEINWDSVGFCPTQGIYAGCAFGFQIAQSGPPPVPVVTPPQDPGCGPSVQGAVNQALAGSGTTFTAVNLTAGVDVGGNWNYTFQSGTIDYSTASAIANQINNGSGWGPGTRVGGIPSLHMEGASVLPQADMWIVQFDAHGDGISPNIPIIGPPAHGVYDVVWGNAVPSGSLGCHL